MSEYEVRDLAPRDREAVYAFLSKEAYWSQGMPREIFDAAIASSMSFAAYRGAELVGYARVVTDRGTFAWLCDVFVLPPHRGKGVARRLMDAVMAHRDLARVRNFILATHDAQGLYAKYGFTPLTEPAHWMRIRRPYR